MNQALRDFAASVVPLALKRRHEKFIVGRRARANDSATISYVAEHGTEVLHGPFAGLEYPTDVAPGDLVAKLVGSYEQELHPVFERWIEAGVPRLIDVGSAEGYYAVGLARALPKSTVYAYDIDAGQRESCATLAEHNGVEKRVVLGEMCTPLTLAEHPRKGVALLVDAEGYERTLLDPDVAPNIRGWHLLAELHEFIDDGILAVLQERFADSHQIEVIDETVRDPAAIAELAFLPAGAAAKLIDEFRPAKMRWAALTPR
jgi:hypothetical protein